eukprot:NODE_1607_length_1887_cov_37.264172_g1357_i0.p1 GENE.NODE_1607_length_1887_cov_37.264172_g1357_i0~~NODE_1607_length_1887_cov_37.264172_g1357_i0.p1  ORF type:complete len:544 (+),score=36.57 NODE_1607_length_1887_cov_37.264172_g1357_i0:202-1632(+)
MKESYKYHVCVLCQKSTSDQQDHEKKYHSVNNPTTYEPLTNEFIVKKCRESPSPGILLYTMETEIYKRMNEASRSFDDGVIRDHLPVFKAKELKMINEIAIGLYVFRAIKGLLSFEVGQHICLSLTSATLNADEIKNFLGRDDGTIFIFLSATGRRIKKISDFPDEDEVLFPMGTSFKVVADKKSSEGLTKLLFSLLKIDDKCKDNYAIYELEESGCINLSDEWNKVRKDFHMINHPGKNKVLHAIGWNGYPHSIIKEIPLTEENIKEKIYKNCRLTCSLKHTNLIPILSCFHDQNSIYLWMPYYKNGDMSKIQKGDINEHSLLQYSIQLSNALNYLHERSVIHGDIKPHNILLNDDRSKVYIIDYDNAKVIKDGASHTQSIGPVTQNFMAPEIKVEPKRITTMSDIYSFGLTLRFLIDNGIGIPHEVGWKKCAPKFTDIIRKMTNQNPSKRPNAGLIIVFQQYSLTYYFLRQVQS